MPKKLEQIRESISKKLKGKINPNTKKPYSDSEISAIATTQFKKTEGKELFKLKFIKGLEYKEDDGEFYSEGYVATSHADKYGDVIPKTTLQKIVDSINSRQAGKNLFYPNYASERHDWIDKDSGEFDGSKPIAGMATSAELRQIDDGNWGAWVKTHHNKTHPNFDTIKYNVEHGYYPGYSIEYFTLKEHEFDNHRILDSIDMVGYGFADARSIANPSAKITGWAVKEFYEDKDIMIKEDPMSEEEVKTEAPVEAEAPAEEVKAEEPAKEEAPKEVEKPAEEAKEEAPVAEKEISEHVKAATIEMKEFMKKELKSLSLNTPSINAGAKSVSLEVKEYGDALVSGNYNRIRSATAGVVTKETIRNIWNAGERETQFEVKTGFGELSNKIEYKATLESDTNVQSDTDYYQAAAETADVFDPMLYRQLYDVTTLTGILPKVDASKYGVAYEFRAEYSELTAGKYDESSTAAANGLTEGYTSRARYKQMFALYGAYFGVTGFAEAGAEATGGIGSLYSKEVENAGIALKKKINSDLFAGTSNGMTAGNDTVLSLKYLVDDGGTYDALYGVARSSGNTLNQGTDEAMSSENVSRGQLRKMIRTVVKNGAESSNLIFVCDHVQRDKILGLLDAGQRFSNSTQPRAGFEGLVHFDAIPVYPDADCDDDYIYLIDINATFLAVKKAPTLVPLAVTRDARTGLVKTYLNLVCTKPNHNYKATGFATT